MDKQFEAGGDITDWPPNVPGKPTQAAVFGCYHPTRGKVCEILWTGSFPNLEPAMYWAAKKEMQAVRKEKWVMASRVLWQHELTPEQAVRVCFKHMEPQLDRALGGLKKTGEFDVGEGPMKAIKPGEAKEYYVEVADRKTDETLASFVAPAPPQGVPFADLSGSDDEDETPFQWIPNDPRGQ